MLLLKCHDFIKKESLILLNRIKKIIYFFIQQIYNAGIYRLIYIIPKIKSFFYTKKYLSNHCKDDLAFILSEGNKGWILDAICKEIANCYQGKYSFSYGHYFPGRYFIRYFPRNLPFPSAKRYFFAHYSYFAVCLKLYPNLWNAQSFIFYTHPKGIIDDEEFVYVMNKATKVICMNSQFAKRLIDYGVDSNKVTYCLGAADPKLFKYHERTGKGLIGFCTAYYPRKNPDRIFNIVKLMPKYSFILIGKGWEKYDKFPELLELKNFSYVQASYEEYPSLYAKMDIFVSPAELEGGPIPLIEAMMCNVFPVASRTGFAPDIIEHGKNGFLFDNTDSDIYICDLIEKSFEIKTEVRSSVEHLSWNNYSNKIIEIINSY